MKRNALREYRALELPPIASLVPLALLASLMLLVLLVPLGSCSRSADETETTAGATGGETADDAGPQPVSSFAAVLGLDRQWSGDLDGMVERRFIRALVTYSKTNYFLDGVTQRGLTYETLRKFEKFVNQRLGSKTLKLNVVIIPVRRDELISGITAGLGDIAAANLTITPERAQSVEFSLPGLTDVSELVVTGPSAPPLVTIDDLAGQEVHVRRSSSYWASLERLNREFAERGLDPVQLVPAEEFLEDEDLLEMVNASLIPTVIVDSHKARFWQQIFKEITVHEDLAVRTGGEIAWAFRHDSPQLREVVNAFVKKHKAGTLFTNVLLRRYFESNTWVRNSLTAKHRLRYESMEHLFAKYGDQYGFDAMLLAALGYQESRLKQNIHSSAGAVGVMQVLPQTAAEPYVDIAHIDLLENNIHAGAKYLRYISDRYFSDEGMDPINRALFSFAAYNAGPRRVRQIRSEAETMNLDPNIWFGNVEVVAARRIGRETVQYVSNIAKYYVAYKLMQTHRQQKNRAGDESP